MSMLVAQDESHRSGPAEVEQVATPTQAQSIFARYSRPALAISGFVMLGYVVVHLSGNLLAFAGSGTFNAYAHTLRDIGAPLVGEGTLLWAARAVLAGALAIHLAGHAYLHIHPTSPRPESAGRPGGVDPESAPYIPFPPWYATLPTEWLLATGALIAAFVAFHVAQLTIGATHPAFVPDDPYHNLVVALGFWPVAIAYIVAAAAVGAHLVPGLWTGMRSLGLIRPATETLAARLSVAFPIVLVVGLAAAPVAILFGFLR